MPSNFSREVALALRSLAGASRAPHAGYGKKKSAGAKRDSCTGQRACSGPREADQVEKSESADKKDETTEKDQKEDIKKIVNFTIDNFKLPYTVRSDDLNFFLNKKSENVSYAHMYM